MKGTLTIIASASLLAACCTTPPLPKEVKVPVPVYCEVKKPDEPDWLTRTLTASSDIYDQVKALLAERKQRIGYEKQLTAAIEGCQPANK